MGRTVEDNATGEDFRDFTMTIDYGDFST